MTETVSDSLTDPFADWLPQEEWRVKSAQRLFPTRDSWNWFYRRHLERLKADGCVIKARGRVLVHRDHTPKTVLAICSDLGSLAEAKETDAR